MRTSLRQRRIIRVWLVAIVLSATAVSAQSTQRVMIIVGTGASPAQLREGHQPRPGEIIGADAETVVVLLRQWRIEDSSCEDWVILRGARYRIEPATPGSCARRGTGNELQRALDGEQMVAHLTARVIFSSDPKADDPSDDPNPSPKEVTQLRRDMLSARKNPDRLRLSSPRGSVPSPARGQLVHARYNTGQCLHRQFDNWQNGNPIHLWQCNAGAPDMKTWIFEAQTGYIRSAANPSKCWHKARRDWTNGNLIHLWDCNEGGPEQKTWTYEQQTGLIRSRVNPAKCIHKREAGFSNGNPVHLWDCNAGRPDFKSWSLGMQAQGDETWIGDLRK